MLISSRKTIMKSSNSAVIKSISRRKGRSRTCRIETASWLGELAIVESHRLCTIYAVSILLLHRFATTRKPSQELLEKHKTDGSPVGFSLVWTAVPAWSMIRSLNQCLLQSMIASLVFLLATNDQESQALFEQNCQGFLCRGGEYCLDDGKRICSERTRYCIHRDLVCDGLPHCGENDNSDEDNCMLNYKFVIYVYMSRN